MAEVYKNAYITAAIIAGSSSEMAAAAEKLATLARARAASHGSLAGRIRVVKAGGGKDRLVVLVHEEAAAIEYGHVHNRNRARWVKGLHIMRNAYRDMPRVSDA